MIIKPNKNLVFCRKVNIRILFTLWVLNVLWYLKEYIKQMIIILISEKKQINLQDSYAYVYIYFIEKTIVLVFFFFFFFWGGGGFFFFFNIKKIKKKRGHFYAIFDNFQCLKTLMSLKYLLYCRFVHTAFNNKLEGKWRNNSTFTSSSRVNYVHSIKSINNCRKISSRTCI